MIYSTDQAEKLNNESPGIQLATVGNHIKELEDYAPALFYKPITADATGGLDVFGTAGAPFDCEIVDIIVQCRAANASGTAKLTDGTNDISDAVIMAVDKVVTRAGTIDDVYSSISAGDTLQVVTNGADDRGLITIVARKLS